VESRKQENRLSLQREGQKHITAQSRTLEEKFPLHWHSFFEVELITAGCGWNILNGERFRIGAGTAYILHPTDFHTLIAEEPLRFWNISFDEEMLSEKRLCMLASPTLTKLCTPGKEVMERLCALAAMIGAEAEREDGGCARELCESLLCMLLRDNAPVPTDGGHITGIRRALLYMDVHFRENPSLAQTAAQAGFHPHYFSEMFRRVTGESYTARLNSLRSIYAKQLLSKGFSVTEACYRSGFGSMSNFLTVFKKKNGCSPQEYRIRALQQSDSDV